MKCIAFALTGLVWFVAAAGELPFLPPGVVPPRTLPPELQQDFARRKAELLARPLESVTFNKKIVAASGDVHDYVSRARYWWPDPAKPDGLPYIRHDGKTNPESKKADNPKLGRFCRNVTELARLHYLSGDPELAAKAAAMLRCFLLDPATRMNPNMRYSQEIPGICDGRIDIGLIDAYALTGVIDAISLLGDTPELTAADRAGLKAWFKDFLAYLETPEVRAAGEKMSNNIGAAYRTELIVCGVFTGNAEVADRGIELLRRAIGEQITAEGAMPHELVRTRSLSYSIYALGIMVKGAAYARQRNVNLFPGKLVTAATFLVPYGLDPSRWPHPQISPPGNPAPLLESAAMIALEAPSPELARQLGKLSVDSEFFQCFLKAALEQQNQKNP